MKILVTGAAGFIGSHMCEALVEQGHGVIGVDAVLDYYSLFQKKLNIEDIETKGIRFEKRDLIADSIEDLIADVDVIFHFAAQPGIASHVSFDDYSRNNFLATYKLLEEAKKISSLKLFVNIATSSVYGSYAVGDETVLPRPISHYGVTKLAAEELAFSYFRSFGIPVTSFRPFSVYGERERPEKLYPKLINSIINDKEMTLFEGSELHVRSYTYVGDIIKGLLAAIQNPDVCIGEVFNIGTNKTATTGEGIRIVEEILGKKAKIKTVPKRAGDQMETNADIRKISRMLGYNTQTSLREGLEKEVNWMQIAFKRGLTF